MGKKYVIEGHNHPKLFLEYDLPEFIAFTIFASIIVTILTSVIVVIYLYFFKEITWLRATLFGIILFVLFIFPLQVVWRNLGIYHKKEIKRVNK